MSEVAASPRKPTIRTVAERAGVSLKTVSRVINNEPSVLPATRARVLQTIAELDYEPDPSARNLRSASAYVIGLVYDNLGQRKKALDYYQQALPISEEVGDRAGESITRYNMAAIYLAEGRLAGVFADHCRSDLIDHLAAAALVCRRRRQLALRSRAYRFARSTGQQIRDRRTGRQI